MIEVLVGDGIKTLQDFATCADWELAGGFTVVDGKRVKDEGLLEQFDMDLAEAQHLIMKARLELGMVTEEQLAQKAAEEEAALAAEAGEAAGEGEAEAAHQGGA
jgi:N utilization substance protein A